MCFLRKKSAISFLLVQDLQSSLVLTLATVSKNTTGPFLVKLFFSLVQISGRSSLLKSKFGYFIGGFVSFPRWSSPCKNPGFPTHRTSDLKLILFTFCFCCDILKGDSRCCFYLSYSFGCNNHFLRFLL